MAERMQSEANPSNSRLKSREWGTGHVFYKDEGESWIMASEDSAVDLIDVL